MISHVFLDATKLNPEIATWLRNVSSISGPPLDIWLIGSRANDRGKETSDWDFLAFGNVEFFNRMQKSPQLARVDIDFLICFDGDNFSSPWCSKSGSLKRWGWSLINSQTACYKGCRLQTYFEVDEFAPGHEVEISIETNFSESAFLVLHSV